MTQKKYIFIGLVFIIPLLFSCNKDNLGFGTNMLEQDDIIGAHADSTSVSITMKTVYDDSIRATKITYMLGSTNSAKVGKTRAELYTRLYFSDLGADLQAYELDSMCFELHEKFYFNGELTKPQTVSVYELTKDISIDDCKNYNEKGIFPTALFNSKQLIGSKSYIPGYNALTRTIDTSTYLNLKVDDTYAQNFYINKIRKIYNVKKDIQTNDSLFIREFKGIYVKTGFDDAAIVFAQPQIKLYVHKGDTLKTVLLAPSPSAYNIIYPDDSSKIYLQVLNVFRHENIQPVNDSINIFSNTNYVQGFAGLKVQLNLDGLETWRDSLVIFNTAKLHVPMKSPDDYPYIALNLRVISPTGEMVFGTTSYTTDSKEYIFNFHPFLNYLVDHAYLADEYTYEISMPENNLYGNSVILDAAQTDKLKLKITYTK
jgi:hypothetical protein